MKVFKVSLKSFQSPRLTNFNLFYQNFRLFTTDSKSNSHHTCGNEKNCNSHHEKDYEVLFDGNRNFVANTTKNNPDYFNNLSKVHTPKYFLIGCCDARVPPNELTGTKPGELFIQRNIGNLVLPNDLNCISAMEYAVEHLKVEHIIVMGHTKCGAVTASTKNVDLGLLNQWLLNIKEVERKKIKTLEQIKDEEEYIKSLIEFNVIEQTLNVRKLAVVQRALKTPNRKLSIHGWICEVETGMIKDLKIPKSEWESISSLFSYH